MERNSAKSIVLELMSDGKTHSIEEIDEYVKKRMSLKANTSTVRNVLFNLKKTKTNFKNVARGEYILALEDQEEQDDQQFIKLVEEMNKMIEGLKKFDWVNCTDAELKRARQNVGMLRKLEKSINGLTRLS